MHACIPFLMDDELAAEIAPELETLFAQAPDAFDRTAEEAAEQLLNLLSTIFARADIAATRQLIEHLPLPTAAFYLHTLQQLRQRLLLDAWEFDLPLAPASPAAPASHAERQRFYRTLQEDLHKAAPPYS